MKHHIFKTLLSILLLISVHSIAQRNTLDNGNLPTATIERYHFSAKDKDAQIWSAMYIASNNKIYIGLCTHADAASVYEFDISTRKMKQLANLTILLNERGQGIWTNGKIHVKMQELDGYVYFGSFCEDNGPPAIDASSYNGPYWFRINMEDGEVETLSKINSFWGLIGQEMDRERRIIYGLTEEGHLCRYFIDENYTEDMGRVDNWDICRTLLIDPSGNLFGSYAPGKIWKYDPEKDRIFDLENLRVPVTLTWMRLPGEYWEGLKSWDYPILEQVVEAPDGRVFASTHDGYVVQLDFASEKVIVLGKPRIMRRMRAMNVGIDNKLYMITGEFERSCKLHTYDLSGQEGFRELGPFSVDRSPYYAKRSYQFDAMAIGPDGTVFCGESDRGGKLFFYMPGNDEFKGKLNPTNPVVERQRKDTPALIQERL